MLHIVTWLNQVDDLGSPGGAIEVWKLNHQQDPTILTAWATHFRQHYCNDAMIDQLRNGTPHSRKEFLEQIIFPDSRVAPGPSIRSGDFGELLVADYLEFTRQYWVPRLRMDNKAVRNESIKGCDVIGFKIVREGRFSPQDELVIYETKAQLSALNEENRLQTAINDSAKDFLRKATALNFLKRRLIEKEDPHSARVERFQNPVENPFVEINGAAAVLSTHVFDESNFETTAIEDHPNHENLRLLVIHGDNLMPFVHALYERAADEA